MIPREQIMIPRANEMFSHVFGCGRYRVDVSHPGTVGDVKSFMYHITLNRPGHAPQIFSDRDFDLAVDKLIAVTGATKAPYETLAVNGAHHRRSYRHPHYRMCSANGFPWVESRQTGERVKSFYTRREMKKMREWIFENLGFDCWQIETEYPWSD